MRAAACALSLLAAGLASAAEFKSVEESAAVLYDAPSRAAKPLYVVSKHYPLEVIVNLDAWVKVRDHSGALAWVERKTLGERRMVVVTASLAEVRRQPEENAALVFSAAQSVALELLEITPGGWLRVRHADGATGFVRARQVWGI